MVKVRSIPKRWVYYSIFIVLVILLFIMLQQLGRKEKKQSVAPPPSIIVIDSGKGSFGYKTADNENKGVPVYPGGLPKYSNSQNPIDYQQVGILTSNETDKEPVVLPLFGRKVHGRSDRWQYYTATDKNNMMRVPLKVGSRECEDDVGCQEIYTGDKLTVDIYQGREFTATVYKTESPKYFASPY